MALPRRVETLGRRPLTMHERKDANPLAMQAAQRIVSREAGELEGSEEILTVAAFQSSI